MTLETYRVTASFPKEEMYLRTPFRWGNVSLLQIARGSASETEYHFLLARDLHFLEDKDFQFLNCQADELQRMLTALMQSVRSAKSA